MLISAPSDRGARGFTLVEMLVVLTVLSLAALLAGQNLGSRPNFLQRATARVKLVNAIQAAQQEARRSNSIQTLEPSKIVPGASVTTQVPLIGRGAGLLLLYPDGSSNGATIRLGEIPLLTVEWLTGEVHNASRP